MVAGSFTLRGVAASVLVTIPFDGAPVDVTIAFARPDNPFSLAVLTFGGTGYILVQLKAGALALIDVSMDFGALVEVDFKVARAKVQAVGGLRIVGGAQGYQFDAFLRFGGEIELLGIVSVSVSLKLTLSYREEPTRRVLIGQATLVVEIDLLFLSESLELDSGEWVIFGSASAPLPHPQDQPSNDLVFEPIVSAGALADAGRAGGATARLNVERVARREQTALAWQRYQEAFAA